MKWCIVATRGGEDDFLAARRVNGTGCDALKWDELATGPSYLAVVHWAPRALTIAFAIFLGLFALDVFSEHLSFGQLLIALAMHLVPSLVLLVLLAISWKWEWVGISFIALGLYYYISLAHQRHFALALVAIAIGSLFVVSWFLRSENRR